MSTNGHAPWEDSLAAYLLGALPEDEGREFRRHLEGCERCREEAASLAVAVGVLPAAVRPVRPPAELKSRIMSVVESEAELLQAAGTGAARPPRAGERQRRGWRGWFPRPVITAAAAAVALTVGVAAGVAIVGDDGAAQRTLAAQVSYPAAKASVVVDGSKGTLVVRDMPAPARGRVYQVWLDRGGAPIPAGATFMLRSGNVNIPKALRKGDQVMVTSEPSGGSPAPTRMPVVVARPV